MSGKSAGSYSTKKYKKIKNDLMNLAKDEIKTTKNSNKDLKITKFYDSDKKVTHSNYSKTTKSLEKANLQGVSPNIQIIEKDDNNNEQNDVNSSDLSDDDE